MVDILICKLSFDILHRAKLIKEYKGDNKYI